MRGVTMEDLHGLIAPVKGPCLSLYMPTPRRYPETQQGPLRYRNLLGQAEAALRQSYTSHEVHQFLEPFRPLVDDALFWTHRLDGLAVLGSREGLHVFDLARPVPERVIVADSFHIKPLLRIAQSADRFHVLCLHRDRIRLLEGNRDGLYPIEPAGVPLTYEDTVGGNTAEGAGMMPAEMHVGDIQPSQKAGGVAGAFIRDTEQAKYEAKRFFRRSIRRSSTM